MKTYAFFNRSGCICFIPEEIRHAAQRELYVIKNGGTWYTRLSKIGGKIKVFVSKPIPGYPKPGTDAVRRLEAALEKGA